MSMLTISPLTFFLVLAAAWVVLVFGTGGRVDFTRPENNPCKRVRPNGDPYEL